MNALYGFISTGDKVAMYTLRVMCEVNVVIQGCNRTILKDYFIQNLSNDRETAILKATQILAEQDLDLKNDPSFELNEIKRVRQEEKEELERAVKEAEERQKAQIEKYFVESIESDVFVTGMYTGHPVYDVAQNNLQYLFWLASHDVSEAKSKFDINVQIAKNYIEKNGLQKPGFVGEIGADVELELKLKSVHWTTGQFPTLCHNCETLNGEIVRFYSVAKAFKNIEENEIFKIKGIVKHHTETLTGRLITVINKPKLVK